MEIKKIAITQINPAEYNPRIDLKPGDPEYDKLKKSIEEFGYVDPLIWNKRTGNLVGGHQRFKILKSNGITEVDVSVVDLDIDKEKALNLALNKISGGWDESKLATLLQELDESDIGIELTGFDESEFDELIDSLESQLPVEAEDDDFNIEKELQSIEEPETRPGDIWQLGHHRLICGDSTDIKAISRLMDGQLASMVFTDPPYNVNYEGKTEESLKIMNDKMDDKQFYQFLFDLYTSMFSVTEEGGAIYVCHADSEGQNFRRAMVESGWLLKQCIIWVKNQIVIGRQDYQWQHEPILYGWKPGASHRWYGDRKQSTVWFFDKPQRNGEHPTMKPVPLVATAIQNSSKKGDIVLDVCGGSGTTLISAEQTERICYMSEMDPKYCDVIKNRYESLTGNKAKLLMRA
ncbi:site-specific DNA-methyltransferase [Heyndrickxia coagulans]|uniref:site-specific DNA-methyltransferase n=1 Tax=Heyndrickxia coagulans TaxID=1398 RepID=UPI0008F8722C|nr:site-specific DNA-methyltransferase [Heyndrickxia coagulans]APB37967.1 DNA modification methylase [Heyndrickxia coagulans]WNE61788.1 DNA modification methylase [Heyndrickxia coagulans]